jgi:choline kinase
MQKITDAVILMAGTGSRLNGAEADLPKPLISIGGRPLISYAIESFAQVGVTTLHTIVGAKAEMLTREIETLIPQGMTLNPIHNSAWQKQNGISVLCAMHWVRSPFFLAMGDHLFEPSILQRLLAESDFNQLNVAVDRKIKAIFDLDDAMKVQTHGKFVAAIGKQLGRYDAIDTGLFLSSPDFFGFLDRARQNDDCSLADGVRVMAAAGKVKAIDIGDAWWQDVDTPAMLQRAEAGVCACAISR